MDTNLNEIWIVKSTANISAVRHEPIFFVDTKDPEKIKEYWKAVARATDGATTQIYVGPLEKISAADAVTHIIEISKVKSSTDILTVHHEPIFSIDTKDLEKIKEYWKALARATDAVTPQTFDNQVEGVNAVAAAIRANEISVNVLGQRLQGSGLAEFRNVMQNNLRLRRVTFAEDLEQVRLFYSPLEKFESPSLLFDVILFFFQNSMFFYGLIFISVVYYSMVYLWKCVGVCSNVVG